MSAKSIQILDTTLREGEQTPGVSFTIDQKVNIVKMLCDFGVDFIELGHPVVSPDIYRTVQKINTLKIDSQTVVHSRLKKSDIDDAISLKASWVGLFFDVSKDRLLTKYGLNEEKSLVRINESIRYAKKNGLKIRFTAEDASRTDLDYLLRIGELVEKAGADRFGFADTVGILYPHKVSEVITELVNHLNIPIHVHFHNDFGLATANALQAVQSGASCVDVTVNGLGERCGITSLAEITATIDELLHIKNSWNFKVISSLSVFVDEITNKIVQNIRPITGYNSFTHNAGLHAAAVIKDPATYESMSPEKFGQIRNIFIDKFSGKDAVNYRLKKLGFNLPNEIIIEILSRIKSKPAITNWTDERLLSVIKSLPKESLKKPSKTA